MTREEAIRWTRRARMIEAIKTALAIIGGLTVASAVAMAIIIFKR